MSERGSRTKRSMSAERGSRPKSAMSIDRASRSKSKDSSSSKRKGTASMMSTPNANGGSKKGTASATSATKKEPCIEKKSVTSPRTSKRESSVEKHKKPSSVICKGSKESTGSTAKKGSCASKEKRASSAFVAPNEEDECEVLEFQNSPKILIFLVEFFVNRMTIDPDALNLEGMDPCHIQGQVCLVIDFFRYPPIHICENDVEPDKRTGDNEICFNCGKSITFGFTDTFFGDSMPVIMKVSAFRRAPHGARANNITIGEAETDLSALFRCVIGKVEADTEEFPISQSTKETFELIGPKETVSATCEIFVRLSCLGQNVVGAFRECEKQTPFFADNLPEDSVYDFKTVPGRCPSVQIRCPAVPGWGQKVFKQAHEDVKCPQKEQSKPDNRGNICGEVAQPPAPPQKPGFNLQCPNKPCGGKCVDECPKMPPQLQPVREHLPSCPKSEPEVIPIPCPVLEKSPSMEGHTKCCTCNESKQNQPGYGQRHSMQRNNGRCPEHGQRMSMEGNNTRCPSITGWGQRASMQANNTKCPCTQAQKDECDGPIIVYAPPEAPPHGNNSCCSQQHTNEPTKCPSIPGYGQRTSMQGNAVKTITCGSEGWGQDIKPENIRCRCNESERNLGMNCSSTQGWGSNMGCHCTERKKRTSNKHSPMQGCQQQIPQPHNGGCCSETNKRQSCPPVQLCEERFPPIESNSSCSCKKICTNHDPRCQSMAGLPTIEEERHSSGCGTGKAKKPCDCGQK